MRLLFQSSANSGFSIAAAKVTLLNGRIIYHTTRDSSGAEMTLKEGDKLTIEEDAEPIRAHSLASLLSKPTSQVPPHAPTKLAFAPTSAACLLPCVLLAESPTPPAWVCVLVMAAAVVAYVFLIKPPLRRGSSSNWTQKRIEDGWPYASKERCGNTPRRFWPFVCTLPPGHDGAHQALTLDGELCATWPNAKASAEAERMIADEVGAEEAETEIKPRASVSSSPSLHVSKSSGSALPALITALSLVFSVAAIAGIYGVADDAWRTQPNGAALTDGLLHAALFLGCCALAFLLGWSLRGANSKRHANRYRLPRGL